MKANLFVIAAMMTFSIVSNAMIAPWYMQIREIDAAVEAVAEHLDVDGDGDVDANELKVSAIIDKLDGTFQVFTDTKDCTVEVKKTILKPIGGSKPIMAGAPSVTGEIKICHNMKEAVKAVTYEKISVKLDKAASIAKIVTGVKVSAKGKIIVSYAK